MFPEDVEAASRIREISLDGIRYALIRHNGADWRLGSVVPLWREEIAALGQTPGEAELQALADRGIWLAPASSPPPLAVICCGLGASWQGMGRDLYENFPAAREAMEDLAELADWDLLGLMWEIDGDRINKTRWQIPWLLLLEYAQWRQLRSLGFAPSLLCGHSIGELVALFLAGIYDVTAAWYLFDTRSRHMDNLEAIPSARGGMLAVSADEAEIHNVLKQWPGLHVANRNTPRQYVLSGPREPLLEARKSLRKRRIPAFMLNINLAFHNPAMRVLRGLSVRRLNELEMHEPAITMLSCVTASPYPPGTPAISETIANLDENTVDWPATVRTMVEDFNIRACVELGPRDVLCGLMRELAPQVDCLAADRPDNEVEAMRKLCARLFAQGYLPFDAIMAQKNSRGESAESIAQADSSREFASPPAINIEEWGSEGKILLEILAREAALQTTALRPDMDLRHDLGLRSSRFPMLAQELEEKLGRTIPLENMFPLVTVADLATLFLGAPGRPSQDAQILRDNSTFFLPLPPFVPYSINIKSKSGPLKRIFLNPQIHALDLGPHSTIALISHGSNILPGLWSSLAALGVRLALPGERIANYADLQKAGATLLPLECPPVPNADEFMDALAQFEKSFGPVSGIFYAPPFIDAAKGNCPDQLPANVATFAKACVDYASAKDAWLRIFQGWLPRPSSGAEALYVTIAKFNDEFGEIFADNARSCRAISWERAHSDGKIPRAAADMLALELLYGTEANPLWRECGPGDKSALFLPSSPVFDEVFPDRNPPMPLRLDTFQGCWQISRHALPRLAGHGSFSNQDKPLEEAGSRTPRAPLSLCFGAMLNGAALAIPWLDIASLTNLRLGPAVLLPKGITRECRLRARAMAWIKLDKVMSRVCGLNLEVRDLAPNGRRKDTYSPVCNGECIMGRKEANVMPIWPHYPAPANPQYTGGVIDEFYKILGLSEPWRILENISLLSDVAKNPGSPEYEAGLRPGKCFVAAMPNWEYNNILYLIEGIIHACFFTMSLQSHTQNAPGHTDADILAQWHCAGIGWIRFMAKEIPANTPLRVLIAHSWRETDMERFEAQALSPEGKCILTMHDLEFNRAG